MRERLSYVTLEGILAAYCADQPLKLIAKRFGCSVSYPSALARQAGLPSRYRSATRGKKIRRIAPKVEAPVIHDVLPEEPAPSGPLQEARRLSAKGMPLTAIAAKLRMPYRKVAAALE